MNADNATSNDTQGETLAGMPNSFVLEHRVRCFNHTLQLAAKTLLRPFNARLGKANDEENIDDLLDLDLDEDEDEDDDNEDDEDLPLIPDIDDIEDGIDELDALDAEAYKEILADTAAVREMVTKLRSLAFAIIR